MKVLCIAPVFVQKFFPNCGEVFPVLLSNCILSEQMNVLREIFSEEFSFFPGVRAVNSPSFDNKIPVKLSKALGKLFLETNEVQPNLLDVEQKIFRPVGKNSRQGCQICILSVQRAFLGKFIFLKIINLFSSFPDFHQNFSKFNLIYCTLSKIFTGIPGEILVKFAKCAFQMHSGFFKEISFPQQTWIKSIFSGFSAQNFLFLARNSRQK